MTAPLCLWCHINPVKKGFGRRTAQQCSRKADGAGYWRNFCSRECAGESCQAALTPEHRQRTTAILVAFNRGRRTEAVIGHIRATLGHDFKNGTAITVQQAIALYRAAYAVGYSSAYRNLDRNRKRELITEREQVA